MFTRCLGELEPDAWECDTSLHSNKFAPLLAATAQHLSALDLCLGEELDAAAAAAVRGLSRLTSLCLRFDDAAHVVPYWAEESDEEWAAPPEHAFDCRLLAGMTALQLLRPSRPERLAHLEALARLPALRTLRLPSSDGLPALAPHLPQLTCLELGCTDAPQLAGDGPTCASLRCLPALRSLTLVGSLWVASLERHEIAAAHARRAQAIAAIAACLPPGCQIHGSPVAFPDVGCVWRLLPPPSELRQQ